MPKQPRNSPLTIVNHEFTVIELNAAQDQSPTGELSLSTDLRLGENSDDPLLRSCELSVKFHSLDENKPAPYSGKITINGVFQISKEYAEHRRNQLIEVTATSILYGACREMLANLTARSTHGLLSLPSVSFFDPSATTAKKAVKKTAPKSAKKVAAERAPGLKSAKKKSD